MKHEHQGQGSVYEEYLERDGAGPNPSTDGHSPLRLDRRQFLQLLGGGIIVCFSIPDSLALQERERRRGMGQELPEDFNAFLRIGEDGRVSGFSGKVEYGQGIITSLAQMLAEELDVHCVLVQQQRSKDRQENAELTHTHMSCLLYDHKLHSLLKIPWGRRILSHMGVS